MSETPRKTLLGGQVWVVKIGSAVLTDNGAGIDLSGVDEWCRQLVALAGDGDKHVVLVSSGAIAEGCRRLGFTERPTAVHELQAAAAVGQMGLAEAYEQSFRHHGGQAAMVLLTHDDVADRQRYLNARTTLQTLFDFGVIPIINENDTVATDEIKLGDNDTLAAMVANLLAADVLVLLTDRGGLHERDPRLHPAAPVVTHARATDRALDAMAGAGAGRLGRGGMVTKLAAARLAAQSGTHTVIADGRADDVIGALARGEAIGTLLEADVAPLVARKRWIAGRLRARGEVVLDAGAVRAIKEQGVSLLPVGVVAATGSFERGDLVRMLDESGRELGKGLVNYGVNEAIRLLGASSDAIEGILGYVDEAELIHRDNLVIW